MRYFAWKERSGYWNGNKLLTSSQISVLKGHLPEQFELFETVQTYNSEGMPIECPIFADFDHSTNIELARKDAISFTQAITYHLNVVPDIYFSGNKGFHVILPYSIKHERCHLIAKGIIEEIMPTMPTLDKSVYRTKSLLRILNSPASKKGKYKVKLSKDQLYKEDTAKILDLASFRQKIITKEYDESKLNKDLLNDLFQKHSTSLPTYSSELKGSLTMTPCLKTLLTIGAVEGQRNKSIFILAKFFKSLGLSVQETINAFFEHNHFVEWERSKEAKVTSIVVSVFKNPLVPTIGCKTSIDGEILRDYCSDFCIFSERFPTLNIGGNSGAYSGKIRNEIGAILQRPTT